MVDAGVKHHEASQSIASAPACPVGLKLRCVKSQKLVTQQKLVGISRHDFSKRQPHRVIL